MAPKRRSCATSYRNLISFIPETDSVCNEHTTTPKHDFVSEGLGHEVRSFYENLLSEGNHQGGTTIITHQTKKVNNAPDSSETGSTVRKSKSRRRSNSKCGVGLCNTTSLSSAKDGSSISSSSEHHTFISNHLDSKQRQHFKLLQYAQLGELKNVKDLLNDKKVCLDINFTDFYGWTPLMCAAKEGHVRIVELFLKHGAKRYLYNSSGDTAQTIARNAGHLAVVSIIESYDDDKVRSDEKINQNNVNDLNTSPALFHCDVCNKDFSQKEKASHFTSTLHLFNRGKRSKTPSYFIPNCNRGFQMLLRNGWDAESGLGPEGKGRKYPVRTVLKQDRAGLGGEDVKRKKAKVTHFDRGDTEAVKFANGNIPIRQISVRKAARNVARSKDRRDRRWEQNLRFEMS